MGSFEWVPVGYRDMYMGSRWWSFRSLTMGSFEWVTVGYRDMWRRS